MTDYSQASTYVQQQTPRQSGGSQPAEVRAYAAQASRGEERVASSEPRPTTGADGGRVDRDGDRAELSYRSVYAAAGAGSVDAAAKADVGPRVFDVQEGQTRQQTIDRLGQVMRQVIDGLR